MAQTPIGFQKKYAEKPKDPKDSKDYKDEKRQTQDFVVLGVFAAP